jgi:hypothetical protein
MEIQGVSTSFMNIDGPAFRNWFGYGCFSKPSDDGRVIYALVDEPYGDPTASMCSWRAFLRNS